ncbi:hypothetical protein AB6M97_05685 [Streptococcus hillyeri]|uniref:hypothetical protein n=1 Tax=Streptococcus hillyeri TaxID=2282420 RepID=UPI0016055A78|nr:hypothetical protein [Streptococcus hillyeri]
MKKRPVSEEFSKRLFYLMLILILFCYLLTFFEKTTLGPLVHLTPLFVGISYDWKAISKESIKYLLATVIVTLSYPCIMLIIGLGKPLSHYYTIVIYFLIAIYILYLNVKKRVGQKS